MVTEVCKRGRHRASPDSRKETGSYLLSGFGRGERRPIVQFKHNAGGSLIIFEHRWHHRHQRQRQCALVRGRGRRLSVERGGVAADNANGMDGISVDGVALSGRKVREKFLAVLSSGPDFRCRVQFPLPH